MKKCYRMAKVLFVGTFAITQVYAQGTHYGQGAGTQGVAHSFFGTDAGKINIGEGNSFFGHNTGTNNTNGVLNTFCG